MDSLRFRFVDGDVADVRMIRRFFSGETSLSRFDVIRIYKNRKFMLVTYE